MQISWPSAKVNNRVQLMSNSIARHSMWHKCLSCKQLDSLPLLRSLANRLKASLEVSKAGACWRHVLASWSVVFTGLRSSISSLSVASMGNCRVSRLSNWRTTLCKGIFQRMSTMHSSMLTCRQTVRSKSSANIWKRGFYRLFSKEALNLTHTWPTLWTSASPSTTSICWSSSRTEQLLFGQKTIKKSRKLKESLTTSQMSILTWLGLQTPSTWHLSIWRPGRNCLTKRAFRSSAVTRSRLRKEKTHQTSSGPIEVWEVRADVRDLRSWLWSACWETSVLSWFISSIAWTGRCFIATISRHQALTAIKLRSSLVTA